MLVPQHRHRHAADRRAQALSLGGQPIRNRFRAVGQVPAHTEHSDAMSRELKKRGFKFVGTTICYAMMQAVGMVNDHLVGCFRHREV